MSTTTSATVDPCKWCGLSTAAGSGRFVNRIPVVDDVFDGWGCAECAGFECDECGKAIYLDAEVRTYDPIAGNMNYHVECFTPRKHGAAIYGIADPA